MLKKPDKKSLQYLGIVVIIAVLVCVGFFYFFSQMPEGGEEIISGESKKEKAIRQQLKELDDLMSGMSPLAEEEIEDQVKDLDKSIPGKALTEEEIQKQIKELEGPRK